MIEDISLRSELDRVLLTGYGLELSGEPVLLGGGEVNLNIRVATDRGDFVVRRYDLCKHERARNELSLVDELAKAGYPTPPPFRRIGGGSVGTWGGRPVALFSFLTGVMPPRYDAKLAEEIGSLMARLHNLTEGFKPRLRREDRLTDLRRALKSSSRSKLRQIGPWRQYLSEFLERYGHSLPRACRDLPAGAIHYDFHPRNLLMDVRKQSYVVLDFGDVHIAPFVMDLVHAFNAIAGEVSGFRLPIPLRDALLRGYRKHRTLSKTEIELLPLLFDLDNLADAARFLESPPANIRSTEDCHSLMIYRANRLD